jgi:TP901 family phage tail tape measure protein
MALAETARLVTQLALDDKMSGGLLKAHGALNTFSSGAGQATKGVGQLGVGLLRIGVAGAVAAATGLGAAIKVAGDFQAQLNTINTIAQVTPPELAKIGSGIRGLARAGGGDLGDLTKAYYDLLSAGVSVGQAQGTLNTAFSLSRGALGTTSQAVDVLTTAMNAYGTKTAADAVRISNELAVAVRDGKVTLDQIAPSYANVAAIAAQAGIGTDEIAAAYGRLTAQGVPAAEVTTQMSRAIIELLKPNAALNALQEKTGLNFASIAREKGLQVALEDMRVAAEKAGIPFIDLFGRVEGYKFALQTTGPASKAFRDELDKVHHSAGVLDEQVAARNQGLNFQLARLKALALDAGITIGSSLLPALTPMIEKIVTFLNSKAGQGLLAKFANDVAAGFSNLAAKAKGIDFAGIIGGIRILGQVSGKIVDTFLKLPPSVQAVVIAGLAANRISGGIIGSGLGNLTAGLGKLLVGGLTGGGGGLAGVLTQRGSTPANPLWVSVVGGGIGGGGGGGLLGKVGTVVAGAGGFSLGAATALLAGMLAPLIMFDLIPELVGKGKDAKPGSFTSPDTTGFTTTGTGGRTNVVPAGTLAQITGLIPGAPGFAAAAGTRTYNVKDAGVKADLRENLNVLRAQQREVITDRAARARQAAAVQRAAELGRVTTKTGLLQNAGVIRQTAAQIAAVTARVATRAQAIQSATTRLQGVTHTGFQSNYGQLAALNRKKTSVTVNNYVAIEATFSASAVATAIRRRITIAGTSHSGFLQSATI